MKVIIVGGGQVGSYLATLLISNGHEIRVIEHREKNYNKLERELPPETLIFGHGSDPEVLEKAGVASADVVAAVSADDEINLVVSTLAKMEFGVPRVVARVNNPKNAWLFNAGMGVDVGVNQADLMAHLVVSEMDLKDMMTLMKINDGNYSIVQISIEDQSPVVSRVVKDLPIPANALLITIRRGTETFVPNGDTTIQSGDNVLALTNEANRVEMYKLFGHNTK